MRRSRSVRCKALRSHVLHRGLAHPAGRSGAAFQLCVSWSWR